MRLMASSTMRMSDCCGYPLMVIFIWHTAISIYVVGSKLQGYGTRPKGGMGRLELILGFRGCRLEALIRERKLKQLYTKTVDSFEGALLDLLLIKVPICDKHETQLQTNL